MHTLLPNFGRIVDLVSQHGDYFLLHWAYTFRVSAVACATSLILACALAALGILNPTFRRLLAPLVVASQSFPLQSIAPIIIIAIGAGLKSHIVIAAVICFFPMYTIVLSGLLSPARPLLYFCRSIQAPEWQVLLQVRFPAALATSASAIKVGFTLSVLGAVVAEFIAPTRGLGHVLLVAQSSYDLSTIYICVALLIAQGLAIFGLLTLLERRLTVAFLP